MVESTPIPVPFHSPVPVPILNEPPPYHNEAYAIELDGRDVELSHTLTNNKHT
jgi:hypothetical protein